MHVIFAYVRAWERLWTAPPRAAQVSFQYRLKFNQVYDLYTTLGANYESKLALQGYGLQDLDCSGGLGFRSSGHGFGSSMGGCWVTAACLGN